jgi:hypothetical protein
VRHAYLGSGSGHATHIRAGDPLVTGRGMDALGLDVWRVIGRFCGPRFTYTHLRAVCHQLHSSFSCLSRLLAHDIRPASFSTLLEALPQPPSDLGLFSFLLSQRIPASVTDLVMFSVRRLHSVVCLKLDLGEWGQADSLVALQHVGSIPRLHKLIVRLSGNRHLTQPLLTGMLQHWSKVETLSHLSLDAHDCILGPGALTGWQSISKGRWCLTTINLDFSMNRLGCVDSHSIGHLIETLGPLQTCAVNLELNNVNACGADALRAVCNQSSDHVSLRMWLNPCCNATQTTAS